MKSNYNEILTEFRKLHTEYPSIEFSSHIWMAMEEYDNFWGLSDKEFLFALQKYRATLELDDNIPDKEYIDKIIEQSSTLENLMDMGDDEDEW